MHIDHRLLAVNGIELSLYSAGLEHGKPVWLLHGFPECWYAWHPQIEALAAAGYRVFAPEMRGYGASSAPVAYAGSASMNMTASAPPSGAARRPTASGPGAR